MARTITVKGIGNISTRPDFVILTMNVLLTSHLPGLPLIWMKVNYEKVQTVDGVKYPVLAKI